MMLYDELPEKGKERVHNGLFEMMRVTKSGGEIRLGSVIREVESDSQQWNLILDATLEELRQAYGVEIEEIHTPPDSYRYDEPFGEPKELFAKKYLIIIRKPLNPNMKSKPSM